MINNNERKNNKLTLVIIFILVILNLVFVFKFLRYKNKYTKLEEVTRQKMIEVGKNEDGEIEYKEELKGKVYLLRGHNANWSVEEMVFIKESGRGDFLRGNLVFNGPGEVEMDSYNVHIFAKDEDGEITNYLICEVVCDVKDSSGTVSNLFKEKFSAGEGIELFKVLSIGSSSIDYDMDTSSNIYLKLEYSDFEGKEYSEEIKLYIDECYWDN